MSVSLSSEFKLPPLAKQCIVIGNNSDATGTLSICIGMNSKVNGFNSIVIGNDNDVEGDNCVVVGNGKVIRGNNINSVDATLCIPDPSFIREILRL